MKHSLITVVLLGASGIAAAETQRWTGPGYVVTAVTTAPATAGAALSVDLQLTPADGYKVNGEYPIALEINAPADVAVAKTKLTKGDASVRHDRATFRVSLTPRTSGSKRVGLRLKFALCTDTTCEPRKHASELTLDVK
jgi:hypothetical protein